MTWANAVALYRTDPREAVRRWREEHDRRYAALIANVPEAGRYFFAWRRLVCENCGAGPGKPHEDPYCLGDGRLTTWDEDE